MLACPSEILENVGFDEVVFSSIFDERRLWHMAFAISFADTLWAVSGALVSWMTTIGVNGSGLHVTKVSAWGADSAPPPTPRSHDVMCAFKGPDPMAFGAVDRTFWWVSVAE